MSFQEELTDGLFQIEKNLNTADHLLTVVFPVVKDSKLLINTFEEIHKSVSLNVSLVLKFEYIFKRISLSEDHKKNLQLFFNKCISKYALNQDQAKMLKEIFYLGKKHKESGFEFSRNGKVVILDDELGTFFLTKEKLKDFLTVSKILLSNTNSYFRKYLRGKV